MKKIIVADKSSAKIPTPKYRYWFSLLFGNTIRKTYAASIAKTIAK